MNRKNKYIDPWKELYNEQMLVRLETREKMMNENIRPYANDSDHKPKNKSIEIQNKYAQLTKEEIEVEMQKSSETFSIAGRILLKRSFGKATFLQIDDGYGRIQIYCKNEVMDELSNKHFESTDYGDIIYVSGEIFKTNKGELSLRAHQLSMLTKSIRPLPEKFHGLNDAELKYRLRYVDTIMNPDVKETFIQRSQIIQNIRNYFLEKEFLEVETPMLHSVAGGAAARPFKTFHNTLNMDLNLRIAPELYLKRLVVGGLNRVFEINRNFRNEGLSIKHNPEFTMLEFYQAYANFSDLIQTTQELFSQLAYKIHKKLLIPYDGKELNWATPYRVLPMRQSVVEYTSLSMEETYQNDKMIKLLLETKQHAPKDLEKLSPDKLMVLCFEEFVEKNLIDPTFITEFPTEISPLSRANDNNPQIVDRFELFINGWEIANGFSELNNPTDQLDRFSDQAVLKELGDVEANDIDYDYVRALEYGLPPTAGEGIGIDRLCMLLTNSKSIRDVIFFPQLRKENFFPQ